jgi:hypothetical protein
MASYNVSSYNTRGSVVGDYTGPTPSPSPVDWETLVRPSPAGINATVNTTNSTAIQASWVGPTPSPSPGYYTGYCGRYFATFSTTGVPTQANSITLYVHILTVADNDLRVVAASAPGTGTNINSGNYDSILGLDNYLPMSGNVTDYVNSEYTPSIGWNAIPLNATAINDFNSQPELPLAIVDNAYDYNLTSPTLGSINETGISAGTSGPYLLVETGIGQWVLSINPAVTAKVNTVPEANIKFVNRTGAIQIFRSITGGTGGTLNPACTFGTGPSIPIYTRFGMQAANGDIVYTDNGLTVPFNGSNIYWGIDPIAGSTGWGGTQWQISTIGQIGNVSDCGF